LINRTASSQSQTRRRRSNRYALYHACQLSIGESALTLLHQRCCAVFASTRTSMDELVARYGDDVFVADITPKGSFKELHPAFPFGNVPIPGTPHMFSMSAMGMELSTRFACWYKYASTAVYSKHYYHCNQYQACGSRSRCLKKKASVKRLVSIRV
jgi:hypothetical protein